MVRIDMSEYMEKHAVSRLIGAPPGYVGYDEGGQLTEAVRRRPYAVVLLDEIEKAHPDVFNILLAGSRRRPADRRPGADRRLHEHRAHHDLEPPGRPADFFKPEFINRIDEIVRFRSLTEEDLAVIVEIQLARLRAGSPSGDCAGGVAGGESWFAKASYDPDYGARPLRRVLQRTH